MQPTHSMRKMLAPTVPEKILHRRALFQRLHHPLIESPQVYKLGLVCAPAGYGKTTLLVDFAQQSPHPCCWYILDQADRDQHSFLRNLVRSIRYCFPFFCPALDGFITSGAREGMRFGADATNLNMIIDVLVEAITLEISRPFLLILSNYHEVNDAKAINRLVNQLIRALPAMCSIVIESRATPSLEYAFLLAQRQIFALENADFRLTAQEIKEFADIQGVAIPGEAEVEQLITSFDGWIAGILLGTRLGNMQFLQTYRQAQEQESPQSAFLMIDQEKLFEYLVHEVFGREPEMYNFLREAVILQQMTVPTCASLLLLPVQEVAERLSELERQGLFVSRYEEQGQVFYLCHPVLRDILCKVLSHRKPERFYDLHRRAALLFYAEQEYEAAMYHALEIDDTDFALQLVTETHEQLIAEGSIETIARWLEKLPRSLFSSHPHLLLIEAKVSTILGDQARVLTLLTQAEQLQQEQEKPSDPPTQFHVTSAIIRSRALFQAGEYLQSREVLQEILRRVPPKEIAIHAEAHTLLGISANVQGEVMDGIMHLQRALLFRGREKTTRHVIDLHSMLASSYSLLGNFALAEHHLSCALTLWKQVPDEYEHVFLLIRMGLIKQRQESYEEAEDSFSQALSIAQGGTHFLRGEAYALVNLGELYQEQENYARSLEALEAGLRLARHIQDTYLTRGALRALATTYLFMNDAATSQLILAEAEDRADETEPSMTEQVLLKLTRGMILLHLQRYAEAATLLEEAKEAFTAAHLKQDLLRSTLRLAACQFALHKESAGNMLLKEAAAEITERGEHEHLFRLELKRLPQLLDRIQADDQRDPIELLLQWSKQEDLAKTSSPVPSLLQPEASAQVKIQAFGEPVVIVGNVPVTHWRRAKAMELCFYLLESEKAVRKEQIIEDLWPEYETVSDQAFRSTVHCLRKVLGEKSVVSRAGCYSLDLVTSFGKSIFYDVAVFQTSDEQAKQALSWNDDTQAEIALRMMIDLYQGDYVQTLYSNWCLFQRDALRRAYLSAHDKLATLYFRKERFEESIQYWERMLAVDPCQEEAHYGLMRCYARIGKRSNALRQYQQCAQVLQEELSTSPGTAVLQLYERLVALDSLSQA